MIIEKVHVKNFRSIEDETLNCGELTALVGKNGSGKSSFLRALDTFYNQTPKIDTEDFYNRDINREIVISITYKDLSDEARLLFDKYLQNNTLTVQRIFSFQDGKISNSYHGSALQNPDFKDIRTAENATQAKKLYLAVKEQTKYSILPNWSSKEVNLNALKEWEMAHQEDCIRDKDDGQFFGFKTVGTGYLGRFTKFLFIPALRDAAQDALDGPNSPITELMNLVVRCVLAKKPELAQLKSETQRLFADIMDPSKLTELNSLAQNLTITLQKFVPETSIEMEWQRMLDVSFPEPKAETKLNQDGYSSPVGRAGHGLQRAFIITALQHLALAQHENISDIPSVILPVLVLVIEEPELYQHPNSQRHLAKILIDIAKGATPGVAEKTQVIYGTHSPYFVGIDRIDQIRLLRKCNGATVGYPKVTNIVETKLQNIATKLYEVAGATGSIFTEHTLLPRLHSIMTPMLNEGFFADVAVLVEGEDDVAAIQACACVLNYDLASMGISVISCNGKSSIDRPALIFKNLGIPTYIIWDSDKNDKEAKTNYNHTMLRIVEESVVDFPPTQVKDKFACFENNLEITLRDEIGESNFDRLLQLAQTEFGVTLKKQALKNPFILAHMLRVSKNEGNTSSTLENIVNRIVALHIR